MFLGISVPFSNNLIFCDPRAVGLCKIFEKKRAFYAENLDFIKNKLTFEA